MKILVISPYFSPHKGGSQQYMEELYANVISQHKNISVDVLAYNTDTAPSQETYRGMTIYRIPCFEILRGQFAIPNYLVLFRFLSKLFNKNKYDIINVNTRFFESAWWAPFVAKKHNALSILTDHCATHPQHPNFFVRSIAKLVDLVIVPYISLFYDRIIVTNNATRKFLSKLGVKKIDLVYGGVDIKTFKSTKKDITRNIFGQSIKENDVVITFVGRMIYSKGPQLLFETAQSILNTYPNAYFVFAGDGEMYKKLYSINKSKRIKFTGSLEKNKIAELMSKTDILVHPSLHHEGFPNVLLEASASGCAVISTDKGGSNEIIIHNKTGIITKPLITDLTNNISNLIDNKKIREQLQKNAFNHVIQNFNWPFIANSFYTLLTSLKK